MHAALLTAVLAAGASARSIPREDIPLGANNPFANNPLGIPANNNIPIFNTHVWPRLTPGQALAALHDTAKKDPKNVLLMPGVTLPEMVQGVEHLMEEMATDILGGELPNKTGSHSTNDPLLDPANPAAKNPLAAGGSKGKSMAAGSSAAPLASDLSGAGSCSNPAVHYEWRSLTDAHKQQFTNAIKCLMGKPARSKLPGTKTRWDDLAAVHQHMSATIHNVGQFLPYHRYFLWIFEQELRTQCGYTGPMTWWDETKDAGKFNAAPPFTEQYFGHMPDGNAVCITSGVFKNTQSHIGPGQSNTNHCLSRGVDEKLSSGITTDFVNTCLSYQAYNDMQGCLFFGPHAYGHDAVGGVMSDVDTSPQDPTFFLHHGFVDRHWRIWQNVNSARLSAIGGSTTQNCGNHCQPTTLDYKLTSFGLYPDKTVRDVMDTKGGFLCYKYDY